MSTENKHPVSIPHVKLKLPTASELHKEINKGDWFTDKYINCIKKIKKAAEIGSYETSCTELSDRDIKELKDKGYTVIKYLDCMGSRIKGYPTLVRWDKPTKLSISNYWPLSW